MPKNYSSNPKTSFLQKSTLIVLSILFLLIILEISLRLGNLIFVSLQEYRNTLSIKQKGAYRILCLGESTTAGQYPPFLEEILNQRNIGIKFSVIDKGVIVTNTPAILLGLEENLNKYKPDMVVTMMGDNDRYIMYYKDIPEANTKLFQYCRVYRFMRLIYMHILNKLNKVTELNPKNSKAYVRLGRIYQNQGKLSEAEELFKKALEIDPKNDTAYVKLGRLYRINGKLSEAEESFQKAIELNPKNYWAFSALGEMWRCERKFSQSEELFQKAIELNPKNTEAYVKLGWLYQNQGKLSQSEELFKKALELDPKNYRACSGLTGLYLNQGKLSQVEELLNEFLALNPKNDWAYMALANLYREMDRTRLTQGYKKRRDELKLNEYSALTINNYRRLKEILDKRGVRLVCVQYPMRNIEPLKKIFDGERGVIFVDNERLFKEAVKQEGYREYFRDMFGGDFGHCTSKGNRLLAENITSVISKNVFGE